MIFLAEKAGENMKATEIGGDSVRGNVLREDSKDISSKRTSKVIHTHTPAESNNVNSSIFIKMLLDIIILRRILPENSSEEKSFPILSIKCIIAFSGGEKILCPNISIWRKVS